MRRLLIDCYAGRLLRTVSLLAVFPVAGPGVSWAQSPPAEAETPAAPAIPDEQTTPRRALRAFLDRMARDDKKAAAELLDLSDRTSETIAAKGPLLAYELYYVMSRLVKAPAGSTWPPTDKLAFLNVPDTPDAESPWSVDRLERYSDPRAEQVELVRDAGGRWLFGRDTVDRIEDLYTELEEEQLAAQQQWAESPATEPTGAASASETNGNGAELSGEPLPIWLRKQFPESLRRRVFLLRNYQWIALLLTALLARLVEKLTRLGLTFVGDAVLRRIDPDFDATTLRVWKPVGRLAHVATWYYSAAVIDLPLEVLDILLIALRFGAILAGVVSAFAVINLVKGYFTRRAKRRERKFDDLVVPLVVTTAKIVVGVVGAISMTAALFGMPTNTLLGGLIGGLGIGGIAVALASQETLSNFFGSVMVLFDRPFEIGDWVLVEGIEGEVEAVGFRSTRIRTGINSEVILPNSKLASASVDNWGRRKYRRYLTRLGVEYGTSPDHIEAFCEGIRELIRRQPHTRKDFYAVNFNDFGASALEILLVVYFETPDWATELRERHRLLLDVVRLAGELGVEFAFPTQTLHLHRGESAPRPQEFTEAEHTGQAHAARIAGELPNYQDRPGRVKFTGPTTIEDAPAGP